MAEIDDFWDLAELIPKRKRTGAPEAPFKASVPTAEIRSEGAAAPLSDALALTRAQGAVKEESYSPTDNPLLYSVKVRSRDTGYSFYGQFRKNAVAYLKRRGEACDYVPFFSYIPQYSQLNERQLAYYFYFRDRLRAGETPRADYSYFWLYIYEILNLPDYISPTEGIRLLCHAWGAYRESLPKIDKYMTVWLADYCLIHRLPCPLADLRPFLGAIMENNGFREFYLGGASALTEDGVAALIGMISDYRYEKSRYAAGEYAELYRKHILGAMTEIFRLLLSRGDVKLGSDVRSVLRRDAFSGSLCSHNIKCSLEVEYASFSTSAGLRAIVTAALKYAENKLRAYLAVRSRLSVPALPEEYKSAIDGYFTIVFKAAERERRIAERPAYEALYEAESRELSFAGAEEIEALSWENARLLASEEDLCETDLTPPAVPTEASAANDGKRDDLGLSHADAVFLHAILIGDTEELAWAVKTAGEDEDAFAERINEAFSEMLGDVVLEMSDDGYIVIEDYIDEVMEWTEKRLGRK